MRDQSSLQSSGVEDEVVQAAEIHDVSFGGEAAQSNIQSPEPNTRTRSRRNILPSRYDDYILY